MSNAQERNKAGEDLMENTAAVNEGMVNGGESSGGNPEEENRRKDNEAIPEEMVEKIEKYNDLMSKVRDVIRNKFTMIGYVEVTNGNPNGDPDNDGRPRTRGVYGLITNVCIKAWIKRYIDLFVEYVLEGAPGHRFYYKNDSTLNSKDAEACEYLNVPATDAGLKKAKKENPDLDRQIRDWMCANFFDARTTGAVLTTFQKGALNSGKLTGPFQVSMAQSVDPIKVERISITRDAITTESDAEKKNTEWGHKYIVPYGLYRFTATIDVPEAKITGFSEEDLELLLTGMLNMCETNHSSSRGEMVLRKLVVFKHDSPLGNAPEHELKARVKAVRVKGEEGTPARSFDDYEIIVDQENLPKGVECIIKR